MPPGSAGLGRTVARKSSIEDLHVCAGGLDVLKIIKSLPEVPTKKQN